MADTKFNLKLNPMFDGSISVVERVELTCHLCGGQAGWASHSLWLMGGTLDVYQQWNNNEKADVGLT